MNIVEAIVAACCAFILLTMRSNVVGGLVHLDRGTTSHEVMP